MTLESYGAALERCCTWHPKWMWADFASSPSALGLVDRARRPCATLLGKRRGVAMGFRFTKRIKIIPGVRLSLSKSGISTSLGTKGVSVNLGRRSKVTVGLPGTGISHSTSLSGSSTPSRKRADRAASRLPVDPPKTYSGAFIAGAFIRALVDSVGSYLPFIIGMLAVLALLWYVISK